MPERRLRRAYTLTELLVVVMIIVVLLAATLPIAKRLMNDSRTRDSARLLAGNFLMARTHAARNNRPFGLWLQLEQPIGLGGTLRQCRQVFLAEVQPPYAGDVQMQAGAFVEVLPLGGPGGPPDLRGPWELRYPPATVTMLPTLIEPLEFFRIRFDFRGPQYLGQRDNSATPRYLIYGLAGPDGQWGIANVDDDGNMTPDDASEHMAAGSDDLQMPIPPYWVQGTLVPPVFHPFQILRMPRRVGSPIELINGTCIDFEYSGMGPRGAGPAPGTGPLANDGFKGNVGSHVVVLFSPKGDVDGRLVDGQAIEIKGTLHFLVGQVEKMNAAAVPDSYDATKSNLADVNSVWVSVGRNSGQVVSSENLPPPLDGPPPTTVFPGEAVPPAGRRQALTPGLFVQYCREAATARDQMGGK